MFQLLIAVSEWYWKLHQPVFVHHHKVGRLSGGCFVRNEAEDCWGETEKINTPPWRDPYAKRVQRDIHLKLDVMILMMLWWRFLPLCFLNPLDSDRQSSGSYIAKCSHICEYGFGATALITPNMVGGSFWNEGGLEKMSACVSFNSFIHDRF